MLLGKCKKKVFYTEAKSWLCMITVMNQLKIRSVSKTCLCTFCSVASLLSATAGVVVVLVKAVVVVMVEKLLLLREGSFLSLLTTCMRITPSTSSQPFLILAVLASSKLLFSLQIARERLSLNITLLLLLPVLLLWTHRGTSSAWNSHVLALILLFNLFSSSRHFFAVVVTRFLHNLSWRWYDLKRKKETTTKRSWRARNILWKV